MSTLKKQIGVDVLTAARQRISLLFDCFDKVCVSFSAGKDSTVLLHLTMDEAIRRNRRVGVLFIDLEGQYKITIKHALACFDLYKTHIDPIWVALPLALRNSVSQYEPKWMCWHPERRQDWIRTPPRIAITDESFFPFFRRGMEFEEFVEDFGHWYSGGALTCQLVGIRADESLNRFRTLIANKSRFRNLRWTTWKDCTTYNAYPIYDWKVEDIWTYAARSNLPMNRLYDLMRQAGVPLSSQRICQPYGDDQRRGLWLFHLIEPETWAKVVARVNGANAGALYVRETGNVLGNIRITKPDGHSWESFARLLLGSMPPTTGDHFKNKIAVFLHWYATRGYPDGIPDEADPKEEAARKVPSWRRICKTLLKNDFWCKGLSFTQHQSESYQQYMKVMKNRRRQWGMMI